MARGPNRAPGAEGAPQGNRLRTVPADILAPSHPDWLYQEVTVTGEPAPLAAFTRAAAGSGVVPWIYDYDQMEEDWFHLLLAPGPGHRAISFSGARILARQLRDLVWERHEEAVSLVGASNGCPFDLHRLVPVPPAILRLGPDHPQARSWLWENWGTTWPPRHVRRLAAAPGAPPALRCGFWTADWTPWPALRSLRGRWPALRFAIRVQY